MKKLEGKVAVITGGSSGIGLATAKRFVEDGAHVVITGRREKELKEAATLIGKNVTTVAGDITRLEDLDRLYAVVKEKHGHIDVLFANAGWGEVASLGAATEAHFDKTFNLNAKGTFLNGLTPARHRQLPNRAPARPGRSRQVMHRPIASCAALIRGQSRQTRELVAGVPVASRHADYYRKQKGTTRQPSKLGDLVGAERTGAG